MNRRQFLIVGAGVGLAPSMLVFEGCGSVTTATLATLAQTLGNAAANLETILGNTASATAISNATAEVVTALQNWVPGTTDQTIIEAIGLLEALINDVPVSPQVAELIDLCLVTIQGILALLPASQASLAAAVTVAASKKSTKPLRTPTAQSIGLAKPPHTKADFASAWDKLLAAAMTKNPKLAAAKI